MHEAQNMPLWWFFRVQINDVSIPSNSYLSSSLSQRSNKGHWDISGRCHARLQKANLVTKFWGVPCDTAQRCGGSSWSLVMCTESLRRYGGKWREPTVLLWGHKRTGKPSLMFNPIQEVYTSSSVFTMEGATFSCINIVFPNSITFR